MTGLAHRGWYLNDYKKTLVSLINTHGYHTALMGESHITPRGEAHLIGFSEILIDSSTPTPKMVEVAEKWLSAPPKKPWFLSCGLWDTHRTAFPEPLENDVKYGGPITGFPDILELRSDYAAFKRAVNRLDDGIGKVLKALDRTGQIDNTIVIATTDHAPGFPRYKANVSDKGLGVFLIMRLPSFKNGHVYEPIVSHLDLFPTLCEFLDISRPEWLEGKSLAAPLNGSVEPLHEAVFGEANYHAAYEPQRSIRTDRYRFFERYDGRKEPVRPNIDEGPTKKYWLEHKPKLARQYMFDISVDPLENYNLAESEDYAQDKAKLAAKLRAWQKQTKDPLLEGHIPYPEGAEANDPDQADSGAPTCPLPSD
jgi:arylsulfatase A-like enzyme